MPDDFRVVFIELPFRTVSRPNLGISLLKECAKNVGVECAVRHANLEFARLIGAKRYRVVAEISPDEFLLGDAIFAPALRDGAGDLGLSPGVRANRDAEGGAELQAWIAASLPFLQEHARHFIDGLAGALAHRYDVFCFSLMFQRTPSLALARAIKERCPAAVTVFGGAACEGEMGLALHESYPFIDYVCRGEGEILFPRLLDELRGKRAAGAMRGLVWREGQASRHLGARAEPVTDLDALPMPGFSDWMDARRSHASPDDPAPQLPLETSRGCWYGEKHHCIFCGLNGESLAFRQKSPDRVIEELLALAAYDIKNVFAVDLIFPHNYFSTLLPKLSSLDHGFALFFETKANLTRSQLAQLRQCGISQIQPGIESLSTPALKMMKKGVSAYQNVRLLKWAAELGVNVYWNLLYGFVGEDPKWYDEIVGLVPQLSHLRPPAFGCCRVRFDRFSPLYEDCATRVGTALRPAPAYRPVYALPETTLARLAYHFELTHDPSPEFAYVGQLRAAVSRWVEAAGRSSFVSIARGTERLLFDGRLDARRGSQSICGLKREVYEACDDGATARTVASRTGIAESAAVRTLEQLGDAGLILRIDGKYLSLGVSFDDVVRADDIPSALLETVCHEVYRARMSAMCAPTARTRDVLVSAGETS